MSSISLDSGPSRISSGSGEALSFPSSVTSNSGPNGVADAISRASKTTEASPTLSFPDRVVGTGSKSKDDSNMFGDTSVTAGSGTKLSFPESITDKAESSPASVLNTPSRVTKVELSYAKPEAKTPASGVAERPDIVEIADKALRQHELAEQLDLAFVEYIGRAIDLNGVKANDKSTMLELSTAMRKFDESKAIFDAVDRAAKQPDLSGIVTRDELISAANGALMADEAREEASHKALVDLAEKALDNIDVKSSDDATIYELSVASKALERAHENFEAVQVGQKPPHETIFDVDALGEQLQQLEDVITPTRTVLERVLPSLAATAAMNKVMGNVAGSVTSLLPDALEIPVRGVLGTLTSRVAWPAAKKPQDMFEREVLGIEPVDPADTWYDTGDLAPGQVSATTAFLTARAIENFLGPAASTWAGFGKVLVGSTLVSTAAFVAADTAAKAAHDIPAVEKFSEAVRNGLAELGTDLKAEGPAAVVDRVEDLMQPQVTVVRDQGPVPGQEVVTLSDEVIDRLAAHQEWQEQYGSDPLTPRASDAPSFEEYYAETRNLTQEEVEKSITDLMPEQPARPAMPQEPAVTPELVSDVPDSAPEDVPSDLEFPDFDAGPRGRPNGQGTPFEEQFPDEFEFDDVPLAGGEPVTPGGDSGPSRPSRDRLAELEAEFAREMAGKAPSPNPGQGEGGDSQPSITVEDIEAMLGEEPGATDFGSDAFDFGSSRGDGNDPLPCVGQGASVQAVLDCFNRGRDDGLDQSDLSPDLVAMYFGDNNRLAGSELALYAELEDTLFA